jgi:hypothetical protein
MKKWFLKFVIVFQLLSMGAEWIDGLLITAEETSLELVEKQTEKQSEKETEKFDDDIKEKYIASPILFNSMQVSQTHQYLEFCTQLLSAYLERIELPPEVIA